jgi:uncharacterized protein (TIGR00251 family)
MYVHVRVTPAAKRESFIQTDTKYFSVAVKEPALQNLANTRVREIIAEHFHVPLGKVQIITGHRSPQKTLDIQDF